MEEVEKAGWVFKYQDTELDVEDLDIKQVLDVESEESPQRGTKVIFLLVTTNGLSFSRESLYKIEEEEYCTICWFIIYTTKVIYKINCILFQVFWIN